MHGTRRTIAQHSKGRRIAPRPLKDYTRPEWRTELKILQLEDGKSIYEDISLGWLFYRYVATPPGMDQARWEFLKLLYDLTWFRRTWCVQEIRLSKRALCYWGQQEIPWAHVGITAAWLLDRHERYDFAPNAFPVEIDYESATKMYDTVLVKEP